MTQITAVAAPTRVRSRLLESDLVMFAAATVAAWGHTVDEMRIGQFVALPFGLLNLAVLIAWPRTSRLRRGVLALLFGLFWTVTVIPYHVVPLIEGVVTWQNVSGILRLAGGIPMVWLGIHELRLGRGGDAAQP